MALIRSVSGIRGIVGEDLTPDVARRYGRAMGSMARGDVALGWDSRRGGETIRDAAADGLREAGARVLNVGIAPTPTIGIAVKRGGLAGGVAVTASHNPEEYNGLKFFSPRGVFFGPEEVARLFDIADADSASTTRPGPGAAPIDDAVRDHIDLVVSSEFVDSEAITAARLRLVVDCVNASGSLILPTLLRELGCEVFELHTDLGNGFPRGAEPVPENLGLLGETVLRTAAHAGLACDPDADRLAVVDENGRAVGEEFTLVIAARVVLSRRRGPLVANVSTSRMIDDLAEKFGVPIHRSPVGEINVVSKMEEVSAVVGGEGNGGVILPDVHLGRDAATAAALFATALASGTDVRASGLVSRFPAYSMLKRKIQVRAPSPAAVIDAMRSAFPDGEVDLTDGAKMFWPDRWVHARMSGTEPVVRVIAEAARSDDATDLVERATSALYLVTGGTGPCVG